MTVVRNLTKERLAADELVIGMSIRQSRTVDIAKVAAACGYDWISVDMEHGTMDVDTAAQICVAALDSGVTPLVRVPGHEPHHAARVLDGGAMGVIVPHVETVDQARRVVETCRYPPLGHRSFGGALPHLGFERPPMEEGMRTLDDATLVAVMLESPRAIEQAEAIAALDGIDVLHIGTNDLLAEMGIPGRFDSDRLVAAYDTAISAARRHGKHVGIGGVSDDELIRRFLGMGARFLLGGWELGLLMSAAKARAGELRALWADTREVD